MTKKDYELIAEAVNDMFLGHNNWHRNLDQVANKLADKLQTTNPRFDRARFIKACGITD